MDLPISHLQNGFQVFRKSDSSLPYLLLLDTDHFAQVIEKYLVIEVYLKRKEINVFEWNGSRWKKLRIPKMNDRVVDLSDKGDRWEGGWWNNSMCGWGCLYNVNNELEYEGFMYKNRRICYGASYHSDIGIKCYEGNWCDDKKWGIGTYLGRNGEVIYKGKWVDNSNEVDKLIVHDSSELCLIHSILQDLIIANDMCNSVTYFNINVCDCLVSLRIGDNCFMKVDRFSISGLGCLQYIFIGNNSFTLSKNGEGINFLRSFHITNCQRLRSIKIDCFSFSDYSGEFELASQS